MPETPAQRLRRIASEILKTHARLVTLHLNPLVELETIMEALDQLKTYPALIDEATAAFGTDTATAVANATAGLTQQVSDLQNAATQKEGELQTTADAIGVSVAANRTAAGLVDAPPADPQPDPNAGA